MDLRELFTKQGAAYSPKLARQDERDTEIEKALSYGDFDLVDVLAEKANEDGIEINEDYKEHAGYSNYQLMCRYESEANDHVDDTRL